MNLSVLWLFEWTFLILILAAILCSISSLVTNEAFSNELIVAFESSISLGRLARMLPLVIFLPLLHYICFCLKLKSLISSLFKNPVVFLNPQTHNQIFKIHLLALVLHVSFEIFSRWRQLLNDYSHLKRFTQTHSFSMNFMQNHLKLLYLTDDSFWIHH